MTTPLDVNWVRVKQAVDELHDYFCNWRVKVAAGQATSTLSGVNRRAVVEVMEEAESRAAFNFNEFPFERPRNGELPGFFAVKVTVEGEELRRTHQAIYRENGFLQVYGYYGELSSIAWEMAMEKGEGGMQAAPAGADQAALAELAAQKARTEEEMAVLLALSQVLRRVGLDCMRMRADFVRMIASDGLAVASWTMDDLVAAGQVGGSKEFGVVSKKLKGKTLEERMKVRAKMEAHRMEGVKQADGAFVAASGSNPPEGAPARRN